VQIEALRRRRDARDDRLSLLALPATRRFFPYTPQNASELV